MVKSEREPREVGVARFDVEPGLTFLRDAASRAFDVVSRFSGSKKYIVRASRRGYVRVYVGRPMLKSLASVFIDPDVKVDLMSKRITYKSNFEELAQGLQASYSDLADVRDEERGIDYSLRSAIVGEM